MANPAARNPPLAGKPPFATDEPDSIFDQPSPHQRRLRHQDKPQGNRPDSAYDVYDNYIDGDHRQSGIGALGMDLLAGDVDDDSDDDETGARPPVANRAISPFAPGIPSQLRPLQPNQTSFPIAAPRPGYAAPVAALNLARPEPTATPQGRLQMPHGQMSQINNGPAPVSFPLQHGSVPRPPQVAFMAPSVPSTPHPLTPSMTPITPAFARPPKTPAARDVSFSTKPIMRGNSEETLLPKRGEKGDDFWRRFSMVVHIEDTKRYEPSSWLKKTENGTSRLSRWVWIIGIFLLTLIGAGIAVGVVVSKNNTSTTNSGPEALGGSANDGTVPLSSSTSLHSTAISSSSSPHVTPTNTVAKRFFHVEVARATSLPISLVDGAKAAQADVPLNASQRHRRTRRKKLVY